MFAPPPPPPLWTGFYVGLNIGGGWSSNGGNNSFLPFADTTFPIGSTPFAGLGPNLFFLPGGGTTGRNTGGVVGGGQVGYNYQFGNSFVDRRRDGLPGHQHHRRQPGQFRWPVQ